MCRIAVRHAARRADMHIGVFTHSAPEPIGSYCWFALSSDANHPHGDDDDKDIRARRRALAERDLALREAEIGRRMNELGGPRRA
jgi:hypothetical protein